MLVATKFDHLIIDDRVLKKKNHQRGGEKKDRQRKLRRLCAKLELCIMYRRRAMRTTKLSTLEQVGNYEY